VLSFSRTNFAFPADTPLMSHVAKIRLTWGNQRRQGLRNKANHSSLTAPYCHNQKPKCYRTKRFFHVMTCSIKQYRDDKNILTFWHSAKTRGLYNKYEPRVPSIEPLTTLKSCFTVSLPIRCHLTRQSYSCNRPSSSHIVRDRPTSCGHLSRCQLSPITPRR
jgi:hypothetical protein